MRCGAVQPWGYPSTAAGRQSIGDDEPRYPGGVEDGEEAEEEQQAGDIDRAVQGSHFQPHLARPGMVWASP